MTIETTIIIILSAAILIFTIMWAINKAAEKRLRHMVSTALEQPDTGYSASLARSRALDTEYRQLVLNEHNKTDD